MWGSSWLCSIIYGAITILVDKNKNPEIGDIVLFDRIFKNEEHDHIAMVI